MIVETIISRSLRTMFAGGMAVGMQAALAQEAPSAPAQQKTETITVTGSRIPTANLEGASPVTVLRAKDIKLDGVRATENLLNNLPQVFADQGANISNGASGTATVSLRGLGAGRTLVLINGKRLPSGSPSNVAADLNQIPAPLIRSVEVLTGGASAVYGSDAVAGVVNFLMKDNFSGVELQLDRNFFNHNQHNDLAANAVRERNFALPGRVGADGISKNASLLIGGNFDGGKGNATAFFSYDTTAPLLQSQRDYSACSLGLRSDARGFHCGGSATSFPGRFDVDAGSLTVADAAGNTRPWSAARDLYNFGPTNYYQRPSERYNFATSLRYDINDKVRLYAEGNFNDYRTVAQIAPSGLFGINLTGQNGLRFENPLLSPAWKTALGLTGPGTVADAQIFRRNVEGGGRQDVLNLTSFRGVLGLKGEINNWNYDAFIQFGRVNYAEHYLNDFSKARSIRALDVVADANGAPVCRSKLNGTDPACVPYNIFRLGGVTPEALNYLQTPGFQSGLTSQSVQGFNLSSSLDRYGWKLPWAQSGIGVSFGFEHRTEKLELSTDSAFATGDLAGQGGPTPSVAGGFSVKDYFGEVNIPLIEKRPWAELLNLKLSYRNSDYSTGNHSDSYGINLEYAPVKTLRLRSSLARAVRSPNVNDLFTPQGQGLSGLTDPCENNPANPSGPNTPANAPGSPDASFAACARSGVTAAQYGRIEPSPAGQYNQLLGGNAGLKPETADSYTVGFVLTPFKNFSATVDFFQIKVKDVIGSPSISVILQQCLDTGSPKFCSLVQRDSSGSLWKTDAGQIVATSQNLGFLKTSGIDLGINYSRKLANLGNLDFALTGTYLNENKVQTIPNGEVYDCVGLHGNNCGTPSPRWRHKLRATWVTPWKADLALTWRHFDHAKLENTSSYPALSGSSAPIDRELGARDYFDLVGSWEFRKNMAFQLGINNLFDRDPPLGGILGGGNGNTYSQVYDTLGRRVFMNLTLRF